MSLPQIYVYDQCNATKRIYNFTARAVTAILIEKSNDSSCGSKEVHPEWLGPLMTAVAVINFTVNIASLVVFVHICRVSQRAQMIHFILFYLSLIEALNMLCYSFKEAAYRFGWFPKPNNEFSSVAYFYIKFVCLILIQSSSTWLIAAKNWWLTSIALTRAVSVIRILTSPSKNINEGVTRDTKRRINILFALIMVITLGVGITFNVLILFKVHVTICKMNSTATETVYKLDRMNLTSKSDTMVTMNALHEVVVVIAPLIIMFACNVTICIALRLIARSTTAANSSQRLIIFRRVTRTVFLILTVYILTEVPFTVFQLLNGKFSDKPCLTAAIHVAQKIADFLVAINASCNIVIYYFWEKVFQDYVKSCCYWNCYSSNSADAEHRNPLRKSSKLNSNKGHVDVND